MAGVGRDELTKKLAENEERLKHDPMFVASALEELNRDGHLRVLLYGPTGVLMVADAFQATYFGGSRILQLHAGRFIGFPEAIRDSANLIEYQENRDPYTVILEYPQPGGMSGETVIVAQQFRALDPAEADERVSAIWQSKGYGPVRVLGVVAGFQEPYGMTTDKVP